MAQKHMFFDKTEIVLSIASKSQYSTMNLTYSDIARISFDPIVERKFIFKKVNSEKITFTTGKSDKPIVFRKSNEKKFWNEYKTKLEKFILDNNISFLNNLI